MKPLWLCLKYICPKIFHILKIIVEKFFEFLRCNKNWKTLNSFMQIPELDIEINLEYHKTLTQIHV